MSRLTVLIDIIRESPRLAAIDRQWLTNSFFIRLAYRALLKREPDRVGRDDYGSRLQSHQITRLGVLRALTGSVEYAQRLSMPVSPLDTLHSVRLRLVQQHLPRAETVLDLGGAADSCRDGALLAMGYPYRPSAITIVDLPPDQRLSGVTEVAPTEDFTNQDGVRIHYIYGSMVDLASLATESFDLVWSGQSIEHVCEADAVHICREVSRILKHGGYFCLDTPNAALTRLQSPEELIHPEHKKEYLVPEVRSMLRDTGFEIIQEIGMCPMPVSLSTGTFDLTEIVRNPVLSETPEEGYLSFVKARKPQANEVY